ncbi:MAG: hypothetical protein K2K02_06575 [Ruminococcus sp.]|nr:hypothetical protein [Ruminococcus sp.]
MKTEAIEVTCSVCDKKSAHTVITEVEVFGVPDMDLRPPEPHRFTMDYWVMECSECGYCNGSLETPLETDSSYLESTEYKTLGGIETDNTLVSRFIRKALVSLKNRDYAEAVQSYLYASWVSDDEKNSEKARECRTEAVSIIENSPLKDDDNFVLLKADLLRRNGEFEKVIEEYGEKFFPNSVMLLTSQYQVRFAREKDDSVHKMSDIKGRADK